MKAEHRFKAVLDTNIWISAALSQSGPPAAVVRHVLEQGLPVFSSATFRELETRLWKPKFDRYLSMDIRRRLLADASGAAFWVDIPETLAGQTFSRDPDDDMFVHAAIASGAAWLITGDQDLLTVPPMDGLRILAPAQAVLNNDFMAV
jgi:putative PIN family toxin of toxin-antitoxin system